MNYIDIVFDGGPGPEGGRFIEVQNSKGASIRVGEWIKRDTGLWALRIPIINEHEIIEHLVKTRNSLMEIYCLANETVDKESALLDKLIGET